MKCSHCAQTDGQVQVGHTTSGSQQYLCKACGHTYTPEPKPQGYEEDVRQQALRAALNLFIFAWNRRQLARQQYPQYRYALADFLYP